MRVLPSIVFDCPGCAAFARELRAKEILLRNLLREAKPPEGMAERIQLAARFEHRATTQRRWWYGAAAGVLLAIGASMVGLCDKMMRTTGSYTTEREQFGRPIATFQAVSHRVADCYIDVECLRLVTQQATSLLDQGRPADEASTIAKIWCGDVARDVRDRFRRDPKVLERELSFGGEGA